MNVSALELTLMKMEKLYSVKYGLIKDASLFDGFSQLDLYSNARKCTVGDIVPMYYMSLSDASSQIKGGAASMNPIRCKLKSFGEFMERYCAYYYKSDNKEDEAIVAKNLSTGQACGVDYYHACLSGLLEVVERDSFMLTWLFKVPGKRILLDSCRNPDLQKLYKHIDKHLLGENRLYIYDISKTEGVYTVMTFIRNDLPNAYGLIIFAASHPDPQIALIKSLEELCQSQNFAYYKLHEEENNIRNMKVEDIDDFHKHFLYYSNSKHNKNIDFISQNHIETVNLSTMRDFSSGCYRSDCEKLTADFIARGKQMKIIDITMPEIRSIGFCAVKCCIPGYIDLMPSPFFVSEKEERMKEFQEVYGTEINKEPHPFP